MPFSATDHYTPTDVPLGTAAMLKQLRGLSARQRSADAGSLSQLELAGVADAVATVRTICQFVHAREGLPLDPAGLAEVTGPDVPWRRTRRFLRAFGRQSDGFHFLPRPHAIATAISSCRA